MEGAGYRILAKVGLPFGKLYKLPAAMVAPVVTGSLPSVRHSSAVVLVVLLRVGESRFRGRLLESCMKSYGRNGRSPFQVTDGISIPKSMIGTYLPRRVLFFDLGSRCTYLNCAISH